MQMICLGSQSGSFMELEETQNKDVEIIAEYCTKLRLHTKISKTVSSNLRLQIPSLAILW